MKVKIEYKYVADHFYPYKAITKLANYELSGLSDKSFDDAKADLLKRIGDTIEAIPSVIPPPEEMEI